MIIPPLMYVAWGLLTVTEDQIQESHPGAICHVV